MAIEVSSNKAVCGKCGTEYSRQKGYFPVSYAILHKGLGHTHVCRKCIDSMYDEYLAKCNEPKLAVRQVCRKLDLYWNESLFEQVFKKSTIRSMMTDYIRKTTTTRYAGKSYDDTLLEEGTLWNFKQSEDNENGYEKENHTYAEPKATDADLSDYDISEEVAEFWGPGYTPEMLVDLEQRRSYWMKNLPKDIDIDIGTEAIIRQLCSLELDINRDRAAGRSVDKNVNTLNTLLGSAKLKPTQKKEDIDAAAESTPFGVWIRRWENHRPVPEPDPELQDVDGIIRYISIWFFGHLCKMLGIKNTYCKLYEDEIAKMRVERPEYDEEDDETMFNDIFSDNPSDEG